MANRPPTPSDKLLASAIPLPSDTPISCHIYSPVAGPSSQSYTRAYADLLELARREVYVRNHSNNVPLTKSLLTSVNIGSGESCIYVFSIGKQDELAELVFDGLAVTSQVKFSPADIYPCSPACANATIPCSACQDPTTPRHLLPQQHLRLVYSHFLEAVRTRIIDDLSEASNSQQLQKKRSVKRFRGGFVLGPPPSSTEWSKGWDNHASSRPLVFCQLQIHLISQPQPQFIIHPQMHTTPFVGLPHGPGRPLPDGAPITLLPHGTPAFYLASYSGPTSVLRRQFHDSLRGLGVCGWDAEENDSSTGKNGADGRETTFIIAWINVENKQGEEKGITIIYPSSLCLGFAPGAPSLCCSGRRESLSYIPDLPPQLQPSPQITSATPASAVFPPPVPSHLDFALQSTSCPPTPSPLATRSFRNLTISRSKNLRQIATQVNGYVDSVAKERERERERMRREREREGSSPQLARASTIGAMSTPAATPASIPPQTPGPLPPASTPQTVSIQAPAPSTFYPSPPEADQLFVAPDESRTSPVVTEPVPQPEATPPPVQKQPQAPAASFDPFMDIDMAMNSFGDMNGMIDIAMGMDFGMGNAAAGALQQRGALSTTMDFDITDDDFNFFDAPHAQTLPLHSAPNAMQFHSGSMSMGLNGMLGMSPSNLLFGESPSAAIDWNQFTPGPDVHPAGIPSVPELLPPTPGETPIALSVSAPVTPSVYLADSEDHMTSWNFTRRVTSIGPQGNFEAIRFAEAHRLADGKYAMGKFALPSPPPEKGDEGTGGTHLGAAFRLSGGGWGDDYASKTDPRIALVKKLIGVKRKTAFREGGRKSGPKVSPAWRREVEDWETRLPDTDEPKSDLESDEEEPEMDEETPLESRPSTPPPPYLPLGPTLLHTHFLHAHLLPLSGPLRPPGSAVAAPSMTPSYSGALASVPTPVSPAALLGAATEKSKSLEAVAFAIGREIVENSVWGEAWRSSMAGSSYSTAMKSSPDAVWPADIRIVAQLFQLVPEIVGPLDLDALFDLKASEEKRNIETLEPPHIAIGKAEAIIQLTPSALRFWDKLGLTPKGGQKNATVFMLFEDDGETHAQLVETWLSKLTALYKSRNLGTLTAGKHDMCSKDGVFPMRFDSTFRKTLSAFVAGLASLPQPSTFVFYICTPLSTMSLQSPLLRQVFSSAKKALQTLEGASRPLFQFIPEVTILSATTQNPALQISELKAVCLSTYDRILASVDRAMSRQFFAHSEPVRQHLQDFAYSLARPIRPTVHFAHTTKPALDVLDAGMLLHVAYALSECGKWILCACVDQRGDAHDLAVWMTQTPTHVDDDIEMLSTEEYAVRKIWDFAFGFAKRASVSWRIAISKLGSMESADLEAWSTFLPATVEKCSMSGIQVALLSVEPDAAWSFLLPDAKPSTNPTGRPPSRITSTSTTPAGVKAQPLLVDVSSTTYAIYPHRHLPLPVPLSPAVDLGLIDGYVAETSGLVIGDEDNEAATPISAVNLVTAPTFPHPLPIQPLSTTLLVRVPAASIASTPSMLHINLLAVFPPKQPSTQLHKDITQSFYELSVLGATRWRLSANGGANPILPFHLGAVDAMKGALGREVGSG
ncbi:Mediator of RNA polymerase II transcription subunit 13 [Mycena indigotica]|uniref:Mediator of RNA polymerase II transcription subunit 13 n=1 Tax=Mycena indigotica TaxID=2126181 RepID=A0A8H6RWS8_9AGAR|nr:Mediator of RNA polymerase II transcription subunit 13 [Mycena indigotica]KAF7289220.1 Mediator of RNA polymerase II transcription subunit 13 [Mycena indigotica]